MNNRTSPKILVTGATGKNGRELIKQLSTSGVPVRGMVRKSPEGSEDALPQVEFVTADFDDRESIRRALQGIERAFLVTNSSERVEEQQLRFVEEARAAGLQAIVFLCSVACGQKFSGTLLALSCRGRGSDCGLGLGIYASPA